MSQNGNVARPSLHQGFCEGVPEFPLHRAKTLPGFFLFCRGDMIKPATENLLDGNRASRLDDAFLVRQNPHVQPVCLYGCTPSGRRCEMMACVILKGGIDDSGGSHSSSLPPGRECKGKVRRRPLRSATRDKKLIFVWPGGL